LQHFGAGHHHGKVLDLHWTNLFEVQWALLLPCIAGVEAILASWGSIGTLLFSACQASMLLITAGALPLSLLVTAAVAWVVAR
jgi:hypothetical protein